MLLRDHRRTPLVSRAAAPALAALVAAGCAGARPAGERRFLFPESFDATQVVTVRADGPPLELLASLRRRGADHYEVTLFDPVFATPVLSASSKGGVIREGELRVQGTPAGSGAQLLAMLRGLYSASFEIAADGGATAVAGKLRFHLAHLRAFGACVFPERIEIAPVLRPSMQVSAATLDVSCRRAP